MKLYATVENEKGKREGIGGNEYLDIDIRVGNQLLAALTVRIGESERWEISSEVDGIEYIVPSYEKDLQGNKHDPRTCQNSVPCYDCEMLEKGKKQKGEKSYKQCKYCDGD